MGALPEEFYLDEKSLLFRVTMLIEALVLIEQCISLKSGPMTLSRFSWFVVSYFQKLCHVYSFRRSVSRKCISVSPRPGGTPKIGVSFVAAFCSVSVSPRSSLTFSRIYFSTIPGQLNNNQ